MGIEDKATDLILKSGVLPGFKVHPNETYKVLKKHYKIKELNHPRDLYKPHLSLLRKMAYDTVTRHKRKLAVKGFLTGLPGGIAGITIGTAIDLEEYLRTMFLMIQELGHIYGIIPNPFEEKLAASTRIYFEEASEEILKALFIALGAGASGMAIVNISKRYAEKRTSEILSERLSKDLLVDLSKRVGRVVGVKVARKDVARIISKTVPILGGAVNAGLTYKSIEAAGNNLVREFEKEHIMIKPKVIDFWNNSQFW